MIKRQNPMIGKDYAVDQITKRRKSVPVRVQANMETMAISSVSDVLAIFCPYDVVKSDCEKCLVKRLCDGYWDLCEIERLTAAIVVQGDEEVAELVEKERLERMRRILNPSSCPPVTEADP